MLDAPYLFDDPFYEGVAAPIIPIPGLAYVALAGRIYAIEPQQYKRAIVPPIREPVDQTAEPSEQSLTTKGSWARTIRRWDHGAGQRLFDDASGDSDRLMFRSSQGIDIWTERGALQLLHTTRKIRANTQTNLMIALCGNYIYETEGTDVRFTNDPSGASPTWTAATLQGYGTPATVTGITSDGTRVWGACGANGIARVAVGGTGGVQHSATNVDNVWYANGRLLAAKANILYEVDAAGVATAIKTHANTGFVWRTVTGAQSGIYASGYAGDQNELYFIQVNNSTGGLTVPIHAAPLPDGEVVYDMKFYAGVMIIRTNRGVRVGSIGTDGGLTFGSFIAVPSNAATVQGSLLEPQGEDVWFDWPGIGLGRLRLSTFTAALVPAYASDLAAADVGPISGIVSFSTTTDSDGVPIYKRYFGVKGSGVWAEYNDLVASGWIKTGWIDYGTPLAKIVHSIDYRHAPLAGTIRFELIADTDESPLLINIADAQDTTGPGTPVPIESVKAELLELRVTLTRSGSDATKGPLLRRFTLRSFPVTVPTVEWWLPLILRDHVEVSPGKPMTFTVGNEIRELEALAASGGPVTMQLGAEVVRVRVDEVGANPDDTRRWDAASRALEGIYIVHVVEVN